jgi:P27 family predicted phage terminase small subunit
MLSLVDRAALAAYCEAWATFCKAVAAAEDVPVVIETEYGPKAHPAFANLSSARTNLIKAGREFGITPSARAGMTLDLDPPKGKDSAEQKFFG